MAMAAPMSIAKPGGALPDFDCTHTASVTL
jgi:hypothetical protein